MFGTKESSYVERVDVIGNPAFLKFVEELEKDEDITLDTFDLKEPVVITTIAPDPEKMAYDITIPVLSPILTRKKTLVDEIASIDVTKLACPKLPKKEDDVAASQFHYTIPEPQTAEEVISYYAKRIAQDVKLPAQFAALLPEVRESLRDRAFGETVDLADKTIIRAIATSVAQYLTVNATDVESFAKLPSALASRSSTPTAPRTCGTTSPTSSLPIETGSTT